MRIVVAVFLVLLQATFLVHSTVAGPSQAADGPDLLIAAMDTERLVGDWQDLTVRGEVAVEIENQGDRAADAPFEIVFFEDLDHDRHYNDGVDRELAIERVAGLNMGDRKWVRTTVSSTVAFRDAPIFAHVDATDMVTETNEWNNQLDTAAACRGSREVRFAPRLEWGWTGSSVAPETDQVMMTPLIVDLDGDGRPEVVFSSYGTSGHHQDSHLRVVSGQDGAERFTIEDPRYELAGDAEMATGDIDGDGRPEILAVDESWQRVIAFEHDGGFKWRSPMLSPRIRWGGPALADLDSDGHPEIVVGRSVLDSEGKLLWAGDRGSADQAGAGTLSLVADLDLDGSADLVAGNTAYRADGTRRWSIAAPDGYNAVGNFDADPYPELVLVAAGTIRLLQHDGTTLWGPHRLLGGAGSPNYGGAPLVTDVDGDGRPEVGVASARAYTVYETDGTVKWSVAIDDSSSFRGGSAAFDFDGDGAAEVVYADQTELMVLRGMDGRRLWQILNTNNTTLELPVVADVDADGHAEIVVAANRRTRVAGTNPGLWVYGDDEGNWVGTRRLWNQHTYHVTNVRDDALLPRLESPSWLVHNTYRQNLPTSLLPGALPDLTAAYLQVEPGSPPGRVSITARIGSAGAIFSPDDVRLSFYSGDPTMGGAHLSTTSLGPLDAGHSVDVMVEVDEDALIGATEVHVVVDDDGNGVGAVLECDESNNHHSVRLHAPTPTPTPTATATPTSTPTLLPTATTTATPRPRRTRIFGGQVVFLPVTLKEECTTKQQRIDIVMVIDASTSMLARTSTGGRKLDAAKAAATEFLKFLEDPDQAAIVAFNADAELLQPLTANRGRLELAILAIAPARQTCLVCAVERAADELSSPRRRAANSPVMILLTDGRSNPRPASHAEAPAARAKAAGVTIFTVGLGRDLDSAVLERIASAPDFYYHAPDAADLLEIYQSIARDIPCAADQFWGRR